MGLLFSVPSEARYAVVGHPEVGFVHRSYHMRMYFFLRNFVLRLLVPAFCLESGRKSLVRIVSLDSGAVLTHMRHFQDTLFSHDYLFRSGLPSHRRIHGHVETRLRILSELPLQPRCHGQLHMTPAHFDHLLSLPTLSHRVARFCRNLNRTSRGSCWRKRYTFTSSCCSG